MLYGSYHVSFNCESLVYDFTLTTGTEEMEIKHGDLCLFPNPASDKLSISYLGMKQSGPDQIRIFNSMGANVREYYSTEGDVEISPDISDLAPGIYIVKVISGANVMVGKFLKK